MISSAAAHHWYEHWSPVLFFAKFAKNRNRPIKIREKVQIYHGRWKRCRLWLTIYFMRSVSRSVFNIINESRGRWVYIRTDLDNDLDPSTDACEVSPEWLNHDLDGHYYWSSNNDPEKRTFSDHYQDQCSISKYWSRNNDLDCSSTPLIWTLISCFVLHKICEK